MNTYAERLAWAMECARLSPHTDQSTLAKLVGAPCKPQNIQHLLDPNKNAKSSKYTPRIADVLRCNSLWLAEGVGKRPEPWPADEIPTAELIPASDDSIRGKVSVNDNNSRVNASYPSVSEREKVNPKQLEEFIADLRARSTDGRLTSRRFFLLRELLREGTEILGTSIETQQIATRGGHGPRATKRGKSGTG